MAISNELLKSLDTTEELLIEQMVSDVELIFGSMVGVDGLQNFPTQIDSVINLEDSISSLVGLAGTYNGLVSLHMSVKFAIRVTSGMLGIEVTEQCADVNDAVGEIANMIAGSLKHQLIKSGLRIYLSIPSVIYGKNYTINLGNSPERIAIRYAIDDDWFLVAFAIQRA